jgi:hypothetical protein
LGYETMEESDYLAMAPSSRCEGCTRWSRTLKHNFFILLP